MKLTPPIDDVLLWRMELVLEQCPAPDAAPPAGGVLDPLVDRARAGDLTAMTELVERLAPRARRFCRHLGAPAQQEDDIVQDALVALLRSLARFEGRASIETWMYAICLRVVRQERRAHVRLLRALAGLRREPRARIEPVERDDEAEGRAAAVLRILGRLPARRREVLVLYDMEGRRAGEVAEILGIPEPTVHTRLHHARQAFRRLAERAPELRGEPASAGAARGLDR